MTTVALLSGAALAPVMSDNMEPELVTGRDMVVTRPVAGYEGPGIYVQREGGIYYADGGPNRGIRVYSFNKRYSAWTFTAGEFARDFDRAVTARVSLYDDAQRNALWGAALEHRRAA